MLIGLAIICALLVGGIPIWVTLGIGASYISVVAMGMAPLTVPITFFTGLDSFVLLAVPFFLMAGNVMAYCGPSKFIYDAVDSLVGHIRGGLAFSTVLTCMIYAAITGSTMATLTGVAALSMPSMLKAGYKKSFISGLLSVSATMGQLIPPSVLMVLYGSLAQQNVGALFLAGIMPGIVLGLGIAFTGMWLSRKQVRTAERATAEQRRKALLKATPAILMPLIILGGIYGGIFTPTEAAAVACVYGLAISAFVYRALTWDNFLTATIGAVKGTSMIYALAGVAQLFSSPLAIAQLPQTVIAMVSGLSPIGLVLAITAIWLVMGMFLETLPIIYLTLPVLLPALHTAGISLVWLNIIFILSMQIAQVTPPFGMSLYVTSSVVGVSIPETTRAMLPFMIVLLIGLAAVIAFPQLSLFIPSMMK